MKEKAENPASTVCTLFLQFHLHMIFSLGAPWSCPVNDEIRKNFKKGGANFYLVKIRLNGTELKSCWKKLNSTQWKLSFAPFKFKGYNLAHHTRPHTKPNTQTNNKHGNAHTLTNKHK